MPDGFVEKPLCSECQKPYNCPYSACSCGCHTCALCGEFPEYCIHVIKEE